jgi:RNA polymerase sigma factor for flagellar operon FliA
MDEASAQKIDRRAEAALVEQHLPLVHYAVAEVANRIPRHVSRADLVSAGMVGLAQAARSYDPSRGIAFDRYASARIRGALLDDLRGRDWASRSVRAKARQVTAATEHLTASLGRTPSSTEISDHLHMDVRTVENVAEDVHRAVVLNYDSLLESGDGEGLLPSDDFSPEDAILDRERKAYLVDAVAALPERLRRVVVGYFFEELPMQTLADELGVSESRISQMRAEALEMVKEGMNSQLEADVVVEAPRSGRVARRKAAYLDAVAAGSSHSSRLSGEAGGRGRLLALAGSQAVAS